MKSPQTASQFIQHDGGARVNTLANAANDAIQPDASVTQECRWLWPVGLAVAVLTVLVSMVKPWGWAA
ncbi:MAG: hypothetical protein HEQ39_09560 [Rhizobacter sp.]